MFSSLRALPSRAAVSVALALIAPAAPATAQETNVWTTATVAGGDVNDGGPATSGRLYHPRSVAVDAAGNLYIADGFNYRVRKVDAATGNIFTVAGSRTRGAGGDGGAATSAQLNWPGGVALDAAGNLYIADTDSHRIRKVDVRTGNISTIAGTGTPGYSGDGVPATSAQLNDPYGVAVDGSGNLYIADSLNHRIRKVDASTGNISTVAGTGTQGFSGGGGAASSAQLDQPEAVALDGSGNLYIADWGNQRIRKVDASTGNISTVAGTGTQGYSGDGGAATSAQLNSPLGVAVDSAGNLYIADTNNNRIRKVGASTGNITTVAGGGSSLGDGGAATSAQFNGASGVAADGAGNLYIAEGHRIRKVDAATGNISTVAGTPSDVGDGGLAASAHLRSPRDVAVDGLGNLYIADERNNRIRKVNTAGVITTVAGTATGGYSGDGAAATAAQLSGPEGMAVDGLGNLYIADWRNKRIRRVDALTGIITTFEGTGTGSYSGDGGPATSAQINNPNDVAADGAGNIYIADTGNHRIRKVDASTGNISTVAGDGTRGYSGDGGAAAAAQLDWPYGVTADAAGNVYIADSNNHRIRKIDTDGNISTVAGTGTQGFGGDGGSAAAAQLDYPGGVAVDSSGNLYIADAFNRRIRKVDAESGAISTIAVRTVTPTSSFFPHGVAVDGASNLYIADGNNNRILRAAALPPLPSNPEAPGRVIEDVGGDGTPGGDGDGGPAADARVNNPSGMAIDGAGNVYIADTRNNRVRRIDPDGIIDEFAGDGTAGFGGDGGAAVDAQLNGPNDAAADGAGNIHIADTGNHRIRKVDAAGNISTIARPGSAGTAARRRLRS